MTTITEPKANSKKNNITIKNIMTGSLLVILTAILVITLGRKLRTQEQSVAPMDSVDVVKARSDIYSGIEGGSEENSVAVLKMRYEFDNYLIYLFELPNQTTNLDKASPSSYGIAIYEKANKSLDLKATAAHLDGLDVNSEKMSFDKYKIFEVGPGIKALALSSKPDGANQSYNHTELIVVKGSNPKYIGHIRGELGQIKMDTKSVSANEEESEKYYDIKIENTQMTYRFVQDAYQLVSP